MDEGEIPAVLYPLPLPPKDEKSPFVALPRKEINIMETSRNYTKQMVLDAVLSALCAVLGYVALDLGNLKVTFESLPVLLGALLFGPLDGMVIGGLGTLVYQLARYGIDITTLLWMVPYILCGFLVGLYAQRRGFELSRKQLTALVITNELLITLLNTGVIYIHSKIFDYYSPAYVFGSLGLRLVICVVKAVAFSAVLGVLVRDVKRALRW